MSDIKNLTEGLDAIKLSPTKELLPDHKSNPPAQPKTSSIFLNKSFNSLAPKKKSLATQVNQSFPTKKVFDKDAFFSDAPMAVDDKRWGHNLIKKDLSKDNIGGNVISNPMRTNENVNAREGIRYAKSGFEKYAKSDSPFKDPYSALNNGTIRREGANFLNRPDIYQQEQDFADNLIKSIGEYDEEKEIEKLKEAAIDEKDRQLKGLSVNLLDHQVLGLKFLRKREKEKLAHKGGLLCDDMGLGKTVQMIALIVKNKAKEEDLLDLEDIEREEYKAVNKDVPHRKLKATLVICPVGLTTQWVQEIKRFAPHLKPYLFHGPNRTKDYNDFLDHDVVVTSYETVRSEFDSRSSPVFSGYWHRVVLDEAHIIKNNKAKSAIACYNIESGRRWCLTGTPIQNSVNELQSLLAFLRVSNLSNLESWKAVMGKVLKKGESKRAFELLKKELSVIMLRRTKNILQATNFKLPTKTITKCDIEFSELERQLYDDLRNHFVKDLSSKFDVVKKTGGLTPNESGALFAKVPPSKLGAQNTSSKTFYMSALVFLLRLRQVCCHWKLLSDLGNDDIEYLGSASGVKTQSSMDASPSKSPSKRDMDVNQELDDITNFMSILTVKETKCEVCLFEKVAEDQNICKGCQEKIEKNNKYESAKVLKLLDILKTDRKRKTIVFSQFRELLLLIAPTLEQQGFKCVMYHGKMNIKQKDAALDQLRNDADTTVLLCSLKSGAVGLNLTVASQVVMYDPWWNPQIQEQAVDRVYRIGQTKPVDVFVFSVTDTIEGGILKLQDSKRDLAKAVIGTGASSTEAMDKLSTKDLLKLFGL